MTEARQKAEERLAKELDVTKDSDGRFMWVKRRGTVLPAGYEIPIKLWNALVSREQELEKLRWIPCSERLPEEQGEYEVFVDGSMDDKRGVYTPFYFFPIHKRFREDVTHWRALPEAPKEGQ